MPSHARRAILIALLLALGTAILSLVITISTSLALISNGNGLDEKLFTLLPYIPSEWFQEVGLTFTWLGTCVGLPWLRRLGLVEKLECFEPGEEEGALTVSVATNKGGAVLLARLTINMGALCNACVATGSRENGWWPPPRETLPSYDYARMVLAIANVHAWPEYLERPRNKNKKVRCVVLTREPFSRIKSLYQYAYDGGEYGLALQSRVLREFGRDFEAGFAWMYDSFGRETMEETHAVIYNATLRSDCLVMKFEDFNKDFDAGLERMMDAMRVVKSREVREKIAVLLRKHDVKRFTAEQRQHNAHVSGKAFTAAELDALKRVIETHPAAKNLLTGQASELGYRSRGG